MTDLNSALAPRALTALEIASVIAPDMIAFGVAHRAFTQTSLWNTPLRDGATCHAAENVLDDIARAAGKSLNDWLCDMDQDGEPRFFRKQSIAAVVRKLCDATARRFNRAETAGEVADLIDLIEGRDEAVLNALIDAAGE